MPETTLPTQKFIDLKEIKAGVLYLKDGGLRKVLIVGGVNFDLKSEAEQTLILSSFQNFLNALDFSVQFFIHSRKINVSEYLQKMTERKEKETNELLKIQIEEYVNFVRTFVEENPIISKTFFVIVPYDPVALTAKAKGFLGLFKKSGSVEERGSEEKIKNLEQLDHRVDQVVGGLEQIGLRVTALDDEELTELYYNLYNPQFVEKKDLEIAKK